ncbi:MAG TPA: SDR family NAD(P)-dependent oxidoreductase [Candidatus Synoicihabitans sp.]|nr:SDR family NAD(P)-dependent oxidoreductase [Candidatus Synoicihabitans sp.]
MHSFNLSTKRDRENIRDRTRFFIDHSLRRNPDVDRRTCGTRDRYEPRTRQDLFPRAVAADAAKVYAGARRPESLRIVGVQPVKLDHTNIDDVETAVAHCSDVTLVINNAGIAPSGGFLGADGIATSRAAFEANFFGTLEMCRGFAPVLKCNGGGVIGTFAG